MKPGFVHVCCHFRAPKAKCFVVYYPRDNSGRTVPMWRRASLAVALRRWPKRIIRCVCCDKPATVLDHFWPYYSERCRCDEHKGLSYQEVDRLAMAKHPGSAQGDAQ